MGINKANMVITITSVEIQGCWKQQSAKFAVTDELGYIYGKNKHFYLILMYILLLNALW